MPRVRATYQYIPGMIRTYVSGDRKRLVVQNSTAVPTASSICDVCHKSSSAILCFLFSSSLLLSSLAINSDKKEVLPSTIFWTSRGHRCRPFSPPVRAFVFWWRIGFSIPTARRFSSKQQYQYSDTALVQQYVRVASTYQVPVRIT